MFGSCFRTLAVILVSDFFGLLKIHVLYSCTSGGVYVPCTLYLLAYQVRVTVGDSGPLCVDSAKLTLLCVGSSHNLVLSNRRNSSKEKQEIMCFVLNCSRWFLILFFLITNLETSFVGDEWRVPNVCHLLV